MTIHASIYSIYLLGETLLLIVCFEVSTRIRPAKMRPKRKEKDAMVQLSRLDVGRSLNLLFWRGNVCRHG